MQKLFFFFDCMLRKFKLSSNYNNKSVICANDTTRAQMNDIPSKSHVIPLLSRLPGVDLRS